MASSEMKKRLITANAAAGPLPTSTGGPDVSNAELLAGFVGLTFVGLTRQKIEGGPSDQPMEVWHCYDEGQEGRQRKRSIRGRAQLADRLRFAAQDLGMRFQPLPAEVEAVNRATGEITKDRVPLVDLPYGEGAWSLADAKTGAHCAIFCEVAIDPKSGRAAGMGRGFAYLTQDMTGLRMAQVQAAYPTLTLASVHVGALALPYDPHEAPALPYAGEAEVVLEEDGDASATSAAAAGARIGKAPAKANGKRGR